MIFQNKILLVSALLLAAAPAFVSATTLSYTDESGTEQIVTSFETLSAGTNAGCEAWTNEASISGVTLQSEDKFFFYNKGSINGFVGMVSGGNFDSSNIINSLSLSGEITLTGFNGVYLSDTLESGTSFGLADVDTVWLAWTEDLTWNISEAEAVADFSLFSGTTSIRFDNRYSLILNFDSADLLESTTTLGLFDSTCTVGSAGEIKITVAGESISDYTAELVTDLSSADFGKILISIPEPSAFGLLAGTLALALVASRRRRR